jgi:hypothetical protein
MNAAPSGWHGRGGDGRIRRSRPAATSPLPPLHRALSDAEWERIQPLLPPQKPPTGRPRHDHRTMLNGILAVVGTDLSWREKPKEYGKRDRAYKRCRMWCDQGLWLRIVAALTGPICKVSL